MKVKYCLPIIKSSISEVKKEIEENKKEYQYFEIWLDYIEDVNLKFIDEIKNSLGEKAVFLFRRQNLESIKMNFKKRKEIVDLLKNSKSFLDLDMETQPEDLQYIKGKKIKLILSYHNYKKTPEYKMLDEIIEKMEGYAPSMYKISTFCSKKDDGIRLLSLLMQLKNRGLRAIILGMGEKGVNTRIFGSLWGNEMIFAPKTTNEASAPGQLTKSELEKILLKLQ